MKNSILEKLNQLTQRQEEISNLIALESIIQDINKYKNLTKEYYEITPIVETFKNYKKELQNLNDAKEMLNDIELKEFANEEIQNTLKKLSHIEKELQILLLPKDKDDSKNIFLEIRAGTGGDEAALFCHDLLRMYSKYAELKSWKIQIVSLNESDIGGYKECIIKIEGNNVYSKLKFESGVHRVQRIPTTESQGRIHTSTCTVAVMPETDDIEEIKLNLSELRIDTFRASGAGGQHINKTDSAVRITHLPTGLVVECQAGRSQHSNKTQALKVLSSRIYEMQKKQAHLKESEHRKTLIGTGDRSERIRTYNYPQNRVTDHRINLTLHKLDNILEGNLEELIISLQTENEAQQLTQLK